MTPKLPQINVPHDWVFLRYRRSHMILMARMDEKCTLMVRLMFGLKACLVVDNFALENRKKLMHSFIYLKFSERNLLLDITLFQLGKKSLAISKRY